MSEDRRVEAIEDVPENVERWGWYSIGVNVVLAVINLVVALASGSLAVQAEMVHNLVDFLTAVAVLIGLKLSTRKTKAFPYGLYKLENVITVGLAVMIFVTAYEIARDALFTPPRRAAVDPWMLGGVIVATIIPLVFSHFELQVGQRANSPALIADAKEYRAHVFTTGVFSPHCWGSGSTFPWIDLRRWSSWWPSARQAGSCCPTACGCCSTPRWALRPCWRSVRSSSTSRRWPT
jgi:divalent metal cation (Fe/Co/Zn/Cd) transporter